MAPGLDDREGRLKEIVGADPLLMDLLRAARTVNLPDWAIGGGIVRSLVWDVLHDHPIRSEVPDVDLLFFDPDDLTKEHEVAVEEELSALFPDIKWDATNQARVHLWRDMPPATSTMDGLLSWSEPATAVAIRLLGNDDLEVLAPYGLDDLFGMIFRPTRRIPFDEYLDRVERKAINRRFPRVKVVTEEPAEGP